MRHIASVLILAAMAGSAVAATSPMEQNQRTLARALAGRMAGPPQACLPPGPNWRVTQIDDQTILFRQGTGQVYVNHPQGGCPGAGRGYSIVGQTPFGRSCKGDIVNVRDLRSGFDFGACALGDFIPYQRAR